MLSNPGDGFGGRKLYELARRGEEIERPPRAVHISELELLGFEAGDYPLVEFRVVCSSGTYVRTLADDIARALGGRAHLVGLRRSRIGALHVDGAISMDELVADRHGVERAVLSLSEGLAGLGRFTVDDDLGRRISHGSVLSPAELPIDQPTAVLDGNGNLLAIYTRRGSEVRAEVVLA